MYNGSAGAYLFISHGKLFFCGHKTCNFFNAIFHKKDFWKKEKRFCRDLSIQWILMYIAVTESNAQLFRCMPILFKIESHGTWNSDVYLIKTWQNVKNTNFFLSRIHFIHELGAEITIWIKCRDAIATAGQINFEVLKGEPFETVLKGGL